MIQIMQFLFQNSSTKKIPCALNLSYFGNVIELGGGGGGRKNQRLWEGGQVDIHSLGKYSS